MWKTTCGGADAFGRPALEKRAGTKCLWPPAVGQTASPGPRSKSAREQDASGHLRWGARLRPARARETRGNKMPLATCGGADAFGRPALEKRAGTKCLWPPAMGQTPSPGPRSKSAREQDASGHLRWGARLRLLERELLASHTFRMHSHVPEGEGPGAPAEWKTYLQVAYCWANASSSLCEEYEDRRACCINGRQISVAIPQGLKPRLASAPFGTTEVVP
jgi:hypothetical protein